MHVFDSQTFEKKMFQIEESSETKTARPGGPQTQSSL